MRNTLSYQQTDYENDKIKSAQMAVDTSLNERVLDVDTMNATVESETALVPFQQNTPVRFLRGGSQYALWYLAQITRVAPNLWALSMTSSLGRLTQMPHKGGIYNGVAANAVIDDICGVVPHFVGAAFQNVLLYGWLPYVAPSGENGAQTGSAKDNLLKVLFALNATVRDDANGTLRVENLPTAVSAQLDADRIYRDNASVVTEPIVTAVTVLEHQYITGSETTTLFEGTTVDGQVIVFREPMSNLTATGFTVTESNANYAVVSAGSGTLTGTPYIHTTREITKPVTTSIRIKVGENETYQFQADGTIGGESINTVWIDLGDYGFWHFLFKISGVTVRPLFTVIAFIRDGVMTGGTFTFNEESSALEQGIAGLPFSQYFDDVVWSFQSSADAYENFPVEIPNAVRIEDATLVGVTNSSDVVNRLVDYYSHRTYINVDATIDFEDAGDVVEIYDPFDKLMRQACIEKISPLVVSQTMKGSVSALVGFTPWQVVPFEDVRELLTGSGTWTPTNVPDGTEITIILFGGGSGGQPGEDGESAESGSYTAGGVGGAGGTGGTGGKIYRTSFVYSSSESYAYDSGSGGAPAADGGASIFGPFSSASGSPSDSGYTDSITGVTYGAPGEAGVAGAKGGSRVTAGGDVAFGGVTYSGGQPGQTVPGYVSGYAYGGSGGGAAVGTNGSNGTDGTTERNQGHGMNDAGDGGAGANAIDRAEVPTIPGTGGFGGHGGGGGGGSGSASGPRDYYWPYGNGGAGGRGGNGGTGAPGGFLLYYRRPIAN